MAGCGARCRHGLLREARRDGLLGQHDEDHWCQWQLTPTASDSVRASGAGLAGRVGSPQVRVHARVLRVRWLCDHLERTHELGL